MTFRQHPAARPAGLDDRTRRPSVTATAPTVTTATDRVSLSTLLREGTRQVHREAETMGFIDDDKVPIRSQQIIKTKLVVLIKLFE